MKNSDKQQCLTGPQAYTPREEHLDSSESTAQSKHSAHKLHISGQTLSRIYRFIYIYTNIYEWRLGGVTKTAFIWLKMK